MVMGFPKILSGVRVLDFSRLLPGPLASELLIKLGARVQCVLPPHADPILGDYSPFEKLRRGKEFVTLDLKNPADLNQARDLLTQSDILLEGFRPGVMEKLGLGFEDARKVRPDLLYVSISGYDPAHPMYLKGAHDLNFLVDAGVYSLMFPDDSQDIPALQLADVVGGFYGAFQILVEWLQRIKQKTAKHLQVSIVEGLELLSDYLRDPNTFSLLPQLTGGMARYHIYKTRDGKRVMVGAIEPKFFQNLLTALGVQGEPADSEALWIEKIEKRFASMTLEECRKLLQDVDACISFIPSRDEVLGKLSPSN